MKILMVLACVVGTTFVRPRGCNVKRGNITGHANYRSRAQTNACSRETTATYQQLTNSNANAGIDSDDADGCSTYCSRMLVFRL